MQDTKIIGRIDRHWVGGIGSDSTPVFENDTHKFNADGLKQHMLALAIGNPDGDTFSYQLYTDAGLIDCSLVELFRATHTSTYIGVNL